ncbi:MAG: smalltalk protein [Prevotella sp.]|nr:smalltalk protein [Prevotella sp.]
MKNTNWKLILKLLVAILTAILGTLGAASCI